MTLLFILAGLLQLAAPPPSQPGDLIGYDRSIPVATWPLTASFHRIYPDRPVILDAPTAASSETGSDIFFVYSGGQLEACDPVTGAPLWQYPLHWSTQPTLLSLDRQQCIFATAYRILAVNRHSGGLLWQFGIDPADDPHRDPESNLTWATPTIVGTRAFTLNDRGEIAAVDLTSGHILWKQKSDCSKETILAANRRFLCYAARTNGQMSLKVFDAFNGKPRRSIAVRDLGEVQSLLLVPDDRALVVFGNAIVLINLPNGQTLWRTELPDRIALATLQADSEAVYFSNGQSISKILLADGRTAWTLRAGPREEVAWTQLARQTLYAASDSTLYFIQADSGKFLWKAACPGAINIQPPKLCGDSILTITERARSTTRATSRDSSPQYEIHRFLRATGKEASLTAAGSLLTDPLDSFGGLVVRDRAIILLDASRVIGYAGPAK